MKKIIIILGIMLTLSPLMYGMSGQSIMNELATADNRLRINGLELAKTRAEQIAFVNEWDKAFLNARTFVMRVAPNDNFIKDALNALYNAHNNLNNLIKLMLSLVAAADLRNQKNILGSINNSVNNATLSVNRSPAAGAVSMIFAMQKSLKRIIEQVGDIIDRKIRNIATPPALPPRGTTR